ncbi:hypothetical protein BB559_007466 [Furculomyces boomerangus]|uniref:Uncharacterized protein n=1 Tax=Furculomyces boomerangus TaxID=61424 RepID=A0A2T9XX87_9FUNG|nr:hypothetical protein BB559_007466 [Furculomyces boomerangus]
MKIYGKLETILELIFFSMIYMVSCVEREIIGVIINMGSVNGKVNLKVDVDGITTVDVWSVPQKSDSSCLKNCTLEIVYDNEKTFRYNSQSVKYVYYGKIYDIAYLPNKHFEDGCTEVLGCNHYVLPFEIKVLL